MTIIKGILNPEELLALTKFLDDHVNPPDGTNEEQMEWIVDCAQKGEVPNILGLASDDNPDIAPVTFARILKTSSFEGSHGTLFRVAVEIREFIYIFHDYYEETDEKYKDRGAEYVCVEVPLAFYMRVLVLMGIPESPQGKKE